MDEPAITMVDEGDERSTTAAARARQLYGIDEIFECVTSYLSIETQKELLLVDRRSMLRGIEWLGKRTELPWKRYMDDPRTIGLEHAGEEKQLSEFPVLENVEQETKSVPAHIMYRDSVRRTIRKIQLPGPHRIFGDTCRQCPLSDPPAIPWLKAQFPRLDMIHFFSSRRTDETHKDHDEDRWIDSSLHLPTGIFYANLSLAIPWQWRLRSALDGLPDLPERWQSQGFQVRYRLIIYADSGTFGDDDRRDYQIRLACKTFVEDARVTAVHIEDSFGLPKGDAIWRFLQAGLEHRIRTDTPLCRLIIKVLETTRYAPSPPAFSSMLLVATSGGSEKTILRLDSGSMERDLAYIPAGMVTSLAFDWIMGLSDYAALYDTTGCRHDTADNFRVSLGGTCFKGDFRDTPSSAPIMRLFDHPEFTTSLGNHLQALDIRSQWVLGFLVQLDWHPGRDIRMQDLTSFVDFCKSSLPVLRDLAFTLDPGWATSAQAYGKVEQSSQAWGGTFERLKVRLILDIHEGEPIPRPNVPYLAIAMNLARLCQLSTVISAPVEKYREVIRCQNEKRNYEWSQARSGETWAFIESDLGDLIHWLLSLFPARQAAVRAADFAALGLHPSVRSLYNWRELRFIDDKLVPIDS